MKMLKSDSRNIVSNTTGIPRAVIINRIYLCGIALSDFQNNFQSDFL